MNNRLSFGQEFHLEKNLPEGKPVYREIRVFLVPLK